MAIAFVRSTQSGTTGGSTSTIGFGVSSAASNTLVLQVSTALGRDNGSSGPYNSVTSNISGTTFVRAVSNSILNGGNFYEHSQIWVATNVPAGNHVITVDGGATAQDYGQLSLSEFSGVASVSVVDVTGSKTGDTTLGQFNTSITTSTTNQSEELVIACFDGGGETDLSNYFSTGITTPAGFTSVGFDDNARLGNRAFSHSYRVINTAGPQTVSWGTVADPGAGERLVWAANVATLKALVSGLTVPGTTLTAPASLLTGTATAVRRGTPAGQTLAAAGALIAGAGVGGKSVVAGMAGGGFTFDSTGQPTFDKTSGYTFDNNGITDGVITTTASFLAGSAVGVPINMTGGASLSANASLVAGAAVASRQSAPAGGSFVSSAYFVSGLASARSVATPSGVALTAAAIFTPGQNITFSNATANGVAFVASTSFVNQRLTFTFDSTTQPTFDRDNNYTFDAEPISASQSSVPFGVIYGRQASLLAGGISATRLGTAGGVIFPVVSTVLVAAPAIVAAGAIPGALLTASANFLAGSALPQRSVTLAGVVGTATTSVLAGTLTATTTASIAGLTLAASTVFVAGSASPQISRSAAGAVLSGQASLLVGTVSNATNTTTQPYILTAYTILVPSVALAQKNASVNAEALSATTNLFAGTTQAQGGVAAPGNQFVSLASFTAGSAVATKAANPVGRLLVTSASLIAGNVNGLQSVSAGAQTLSVNTSYDPATPFAIQSIQRPGQTFLIRLELLAGQATAAVNATVNGQTLTANASMNAGTIVYFAAVTVLSRTIEAQAAFLAGAVTGKQLTRRNTGGRAFNFLQEFLQPIVGQDLIFSEQNGPRPAKPYATLSVRSISEQEIIQHHLNGNGIVSLAKLQRMIVEVEYFGLGAFSKAQVLGLKLQYPRNVDRGDEFGISVSQLRGVTRVPELLNQSQYEERAILEFTAYIMVEGDDDVGLIEHAVIQDTDADHACSFDFVYEGSN